MIEDRINDNDSDIHHQQYSISSNTLMAHDTMNTNISSAQRTKTGENHSSHMHNIQHLM